MQQPNKRARRDVNVRPLLNPNFECLRGKQGVVFDTTDGEFDYPASVQRIAEYVECLRFCTLSLLSLTEHRQVYAKVPLIDPALRVRAFNAGI